MLPCGSGRERESLDPGEAGRDPAPVDPFFLPAQGLGATQEPAVSPDFEDHLFGRDAGGRQFRFEAPGQADRGAEVLEASAQMKRDRRGRLDAEALCESVLAELIKNVVEKSSDSRVVEKRATQYDLVNAITAVARDDSGELSYDRATELEMLGGKIIELPPSDWKVIAEAA